MISLKSQNAKDHTAGQEPYSVLMMWPQNIYYSHMAN